jgi:NAD(P)-dependent dehydrogenase (short-subunit alcohol dehydrogenase family)
MLATDGKETHMMLKDKVAVVTGAGGGIGRGIALLLAKEGAKVVVNDLGGSATGEGRDATPADKVVAEITAAGGTAVSNYDSVASLAGGEKIIGTALEKFGRIDVVVNNAGILRDRMLFNMSEDDWDAVIAVHLKGAFACTRAAAPHMRQQKGGRIINMTSTSGLIGNYGQANYAAAKLGIVGLTKVTALDLGRYGVTANCIAPFAWTRMIGSIPTETEAQKARVEKIKKMDPGMIAPLVAFLASDAAQEVSGQIFAVRGKEIVLFSQPRPIRQIVDMEGWTAEKVAAVLPQAFKNSFYKLDVTTDVFPYDPFV